MAKRVLAVLFIVFLAVYGVMNFYQVADTVTAGLTLFSKGEKVPVQEMILSFTHTYHENFWGKYDLLNMNGLAKRAMGNRLMNRVVMLDNGWMSRYEEEYPKPDAEIMVDNANYLGELNRELSEQGVALLYVQAPSNINPYNPQLPAGVVDYINPALDDFLMDLSIRGVDCIDVRTELYREGLEMYDYMYRTDHHWSIDGGFYTYQKIVEYLTANFGVEMDEQYTNRDSYETVIYPQWHLGSHGQRTGYMFGGVDDFKVMLPKFPTSLENDNGKIGGFEEKLLDTRPLGQRNLHTRLVYDTVFAKGMGLTFTNHQKDACPQRVLVVADSMGKVVSPFLILSFAQVYTVSQFSTEMLTSFQPDFVIFIHYPTNVLNERYH